MSFAILEDKEVVFPGLKNNLWVSIIKIDNSLYVEVATCYEFVGRLPAKNYDMASRMLTDINKKLNSLGDLHTACFVLDKGFSMKLASEAMFIICTTLAEFTYSEMVDMKAYYGYEIYPPWEWLIKEHEGYNNRIDIFFGNNKRSIGYWKASSDDADAKFTFHYNINYPK